MVRFLILGLMAVILSGCGYTHGKLYRGDVKTVTVPIFGNKSFRKGIEFDLTEALIKELALRTPYQVVSGEQGDTVLTGEIVGVEEVVRSRGGEVGLPEAVGLRVVIDFTWKDLRTGEILVERKGFDREVEYLVSRQGGERYRTGQHGAVGKLAIDVVGELRKGW